LNSLIYSLAGQQANAKSLSGVNKLTGNIKKPTTELEDHIKQLVHEIAAFKTEFYRCRDVVSLTPGISHKTVQFYKRKF
jgi:hypothetical protein